MNIKNSIKRVFRATLWVLGRIELKPVFPIYNDAIYIVSYPKSGNTWMRFFFANINFPEETVDFSNIEKLIPDPYVGSKLVKSGKYGFFVKSHNSFQPEIKKIVYIVRDPRDVCVSYYKHKQKSLGASFTLSIEEFVDDFINGNADGYGTWKQHLESWCAAMSGRDSFCFLRYEDLLDTSADCLLPSLNRLIPNLEIAEVCRAFEKSSFNHMQRLEAETSSLWIVDKRAKGDGKFVRSGKVGEWKDTLDAISVGKIEKEFGASMKRLGYELDQIA